ncbi:MAG: hypothetical protein IT536_01670 [Hyphomicrobiales bacterium]|nr:hypothetical protein [Hyphomicrobiales bacterium]
MTLVVERGGGGSGMARTRRDKQELKFKDVGNRLREARVLAGYKTAADAARALNIPIPTYQSHENGTRYSVKNNLRYAGFFGVDPEWLLNGDTIPASPDRRPAPRALTAPVKGIVGIGYWVDESTLWPANYDPVPRDPKHSHLEQVAFQIKGDSAGSFGQDGAFVICVPYWDLRANLQGDDPVVVETRQGSLVERTIRRVRLTKDHGRAAQAYLDPVDKNQRMEPIQVAPESASGVDTNPRVAWLIISLFRRPR